MEVNTQIRDLLDFFFYYTPKDSRCEFWTTTEVNDYYRRIYYSYYPSSQVEDLYFNISIEGVTKYKGEPWNIEPLFTGWVKSLEDLKVILRSTHCLKD